MTESITVENGNAWASDIVYVWVDWNNNFEFEEGTNEEYQLTNVGGTGQTFEGTISNPGNVIGIEHRMRIRMTYSSPPEPCGSASYGEVEDYTIVSGFYWHANIEVSPVGVFETIEPNQTSTQYLTLLNRASVEELTYDISINYLTTQPTPSNLTAEEYKHALSKRRKTEHPDGYIEKAPGANPSQIQYSDENYDLQFEYPCADASGEAGIETDGFYIYTSKWNGDLFFMYSLDGSYQGSFQIPGVSGVRDMAYDGSFFYGAAANTTLFEMDFETHTLVNSYAVPVATRAIAYDGSEDGFWGNNWSDSPTLYDRSGQVLNSFSIAGDESFYGFACMDDVVGYILWGYSQTGNMNTLKRYSLPGGTWESDFDLTEILSLPVPGTDIAGGLYYQQNLVPGWGTIGGLVQNVCLWGIEMGSGYTYSDVGVTQIIKPESGGMLSSNEDIIIEITNFGNIHTYDIMYSVSWDNGYFEGVYTEQMEVGESIELTIPVTADLSNPGNYTFEACATMEWDMNPLNDCKTKTVSSLGPFCIDNLYQEGCNEGDGLISWNFSNINIPDIPCSGPVYDWYHNLADVVHEMQRDSIYILTVQAGHDDTWVDVWIDYNNDDYFDNTELILNDAHCPQTGINCLFNISIPDTVTDGSHFMRVRTNRGEAVEESCETYSYGNCCDFSVNISPGGGPAWLEAYPMSGLIFPDNMDTISLDFNSMGLIPGDYLAEILISNNSTNNPELIVPVSLTVTGTIPDPIIQVSPDSLFFDLYTDSLAFDNMMIGNTGGGNLDYEMTIEYLDGSPNRDDSWLVADPAMGTVAGGDSVTTHIIVDATGMEGGSYFADILISSNDPINPVVSCHVSLIVDDECPLPPPTNLDGVELEPNTVILIWDEPEWQDGINDLLYYNVYRDSVMVGTEIIPTAFTDTAVPPGYPSYVISAFYEECEAFSDTLYNLIVTSLFENRVNGLLVYPNPAADVLHIRSQLPILEIHVLDNLGNTVYFKEGFSISPSLESAHLQQGIYFLKVTTQGGEFLEKVVVQH